MVSFAYPWVLYAGLPIIFFCLLWQVLQRTVVTYQFPLTGLFAQSLQGQAAARSFPWKRVLLGIRGTVLVLLLLATARPHYPDERSKITVEGIATMLVLDVSGSMNSFDNLQDRKTRFASAQEEAIKFINHRGDDLFGLVIFGALAASRCPLTADKKIVTDIIRDTKIGILNPDGTMLAMAIALGVNRLKSSSSQSKIMVLLTDGEPSPGDISSHTAIDLAKKAGIKIYTIGIGSEKGGFAQHPFGGIMRIPTPLNKELLKTIATETGGMFFHAENQTDLENIYQQINMLEKSSHEAPLYARYHELYFFLLLAALLFLAVEIVITSLIWSVIR